MKLFNKIFKNWKLYELVYLIISMIVLIVFSIICKSAVLTILVAVFGLLGTSLNTKTNKYCFIFYFVSAVLYAYASFQQKYYGETILNIFYTIPMYVISIVAIFRIKNKDHNFRIESTYFRTLLILLGMIVVVIVGYGWVLSMIGTTWPYLNSAGTAFCTAAVFLASRKKLVQWYFWILYNIIQFTLWFLTIDANNLNGIPIIILNIIYLGINAYGLITWIVMNRKNRMNLKSE